MLRNMVTSLLDQERIVTTVAKAKEARIVTEQMITLGKKGDLHARRQAMSYIRSKSVVAKLFDQLSSQYAERNGGYTRIIRTGARLGDAAPMAILELVEYKDAVSEIKAEQEQ
jgi:large subunit ribosomal protein L17